MTQLFTSQKIDDVSSKNELFDESTAKESTFEPFKKERDSTGKLISRVKPRSKMPKQNFYFLSGQQQILQDEFRRSIKKNFSTTFLVGLSAHKILDFPKIQDDLPDFCKGFNVKSRKLKTVSSTSFLSDHHKSPPCDRTPTPGPGNYDVAPLGPTQPQGDLIFQKSSFYHFKTSPCNQDYYDNINEIQKIKYQSFINFPRFNRVIKIPDFMKNLGREDDIKNGIFGELEKRIRETKIKSNEIPISDLKLRREIDHQREFQLKYNKPYSFFLFFFIFKIGIPKTYQFQVPLKKIEKPEVFHNQYSKMLNKYGFKNKRGKLIKV